MFFLIEYLLLKYTLRCYSDVNMLASTSQTAETFECKNQTEVYYLFGFLMQLYFFLMRCKSRSQDPQEVSPYVGCTGNIEKLKPSTFADGCRVVNNISQLQRSNFSSDLFWFSAWHRPLFKHAPRPLSCLFPTTKLPVQPEPRCKPNKAERSHLFAYTLQRKITWKSSRMGKMKIFLYI